MGITIYLFNIDSVHKVSGTKFVKIKNNIINNLKTTQSTQPHTKKLKLRTKHHIIDDVSNFVHVNLNWELFEGILSGICRGECSVYTFLLREQLLVSCCTYRSATRMISMIAVSWAVSTVISIPPLFGLKDPVIDEEHLRNFSSHILQAGALHDTVGGPFHPLAISKADPNHAFWNDWKDRARSTTLATVNDSVRINDTVSSENTNCVISQNLGYTVFSTVGAFYLPLIFIIAIYLNVYRVARQRIRRRQFNRHRNEDRSGAQRDASTFDPDIDTAMQPSGVVMRALRSRLSAISLGLPFSQPPPSASSMPLNRVVSLNYGRGGSTADASASTVTDQQQQQQLLQPPSSNQFLSVSSSPRLSETNSVLSTPGSSRGGSLVYFTRSVNLLPPLR